MVYLGCSFINAKQMIRLVPDYLTPSRCINDSAIIAGSNPCGWRKLGCTGATGRRRRRQCAQSAGRMERRVSGFESGGLRRNGYLGSIMRTKSKRSRRGRLKREPDDFEDECVRARTTRRSVRFRSATAVDVRTPSPARS